MPLGCRPLECRNVALTTTNASALADEAERLDAPIHARPALAPPVHADLERRRDKTHAFLLTDKPPRDCPPAPPVGRADVQPAIDTLTAESGRTPSVLLLATRLGPVGTAFRRNFPDVCAELSIAAPTGSAVGADACSRQKTDNARLQRDKRDLAAQLKVAIAVIQRLSADNETLRDALPTARTIPHCRTAADLPSDPPASAGSPTLQRRVTDSIR
ncbi:hypothetical protein ACIPWY_39540 [Streptomyces sp. NPDC090032]|uniref:hypothetical protein n=1 Tax=unclassified Streptomyces TaxID=2593676 RepID=UPI00371616FD